MILSTLGDIWGLAFVAWMILAMFAKSSKIVDFVEFVLGYALLTVAMLVFPILWFVQWLFRWRF